jgi:hypothetical protein
MSYTQVPDNELPPNMPTLPIADVGEGWRRPSYGEKVRTHWEYLSLTPKVEWKLTAFTNGDELVHDGRTHYREAASLKAWARVAKQLIPKWFKALGA